MLPIAQAQNTQAAAPAASTRLLRNFSELAPAGSPYAGLPIASGQWWGLTGAEIAASAGVGEHGAGLLANDSLDPGTDYRLVVRNSTFPLGTLTVEEDGAIDYTAAGTAVYDLYEANTLVAGGPWGISAGFATPQYAAALPGMVQAPTLTAIAATFTPPTTVGVLPGMVQGNRLGAIAATYSPPTGNGALPGLVVAVSLGPIAASYTPPTYAGALPGLVQAPTLAPMAATFVPSPTVGVLPGVVVAVRLAAIAAAYAPPTYAGALAGMASLVTLQPLAGVYTAPSGLPQAAPGYATQEDMRIRFGQFELVQLTDRAPTAEAVDTEVMSRALLDADAEINARLHSRYRLPLEHVPRLLVNVACDIARWRLMEDRATDQVTRRYEEALKLLDKIGRGDLALGLEAAESRLAATGGPAVTGGGRRVFSRERLADYTRDS